MGMQRIDVLLSVTNNDLQRVIMPIELKNKHASTDNVRQINRYIDWIEQYYLPNRISCIQPVLICKGGGLSPSVIECFHNFNDASCNRYLPLRYIEYTISGATISFSNTDY